MMVLMMMIIGLKMIVMVMMVGRDDGSGEGGDDGNGCDGDGVIAGGGGYW